MALRGEIVDFIGLDLVHETDQTAAVAQVAVVQVQLVEGQIRAGLHGVKPRTVGAALAADDAVDLVTLFEQEFGEVGAVLATDTGE